MNENPQYLSKQEINEQKSNEIYKNKKKNYKENYFLKKCFSSFKNKNHFSNCTIMNQFIIFFLPITFGVSSFLTILHVYLFDQIFKFDFYTLMKEEYLRYLITDIDDANFDISSIETNSQFEDLGNLMFFKVYFDELISIGLLDGDKIFPNISDISETFFKFLDPVFIQDKSLINFTIPANIAKKYIDGRKDSLSELAKVYYNFYPLISFQTFSIKTYVNQTFLIAYQMNDQNNNISGEPLYFNFPRSNEKTEENNNFYPYNNLIAPKINISKSEHTLLLNDSFYSENWFSKHDYDFRNFSKYFDISINFLHLNINHEGKINKSSIITMQNFYKNNNDKRYIINIIFFIEKKKINF